VQEDDGVAVATAVDEREGLVVGVAYATAAALISQGSPIVPLQIRGALSSEVALGNADVGKALALGMIVVVAIVMAVYSALLRRAGRWSR